MKKIEELKKSIEELRSESISAKSELSKPKLDEKLAKSYRGVIKRNKEN